MESKSIFKNSDYFSTLLVCGLNASAIIREPHLQFEEVNGKVQRPYTRWTKHACQPYMKRAISTTTERATESEAPKWPTTVPEYMGDMNPAHTKARR